MATKTKEKPVEAKTEEKVKEQKPEAISVNPTGPFIAGNTYTVSIEHPDPTDIENQEPVFFQVAGPGYSYNLAASISEGMARGTFLAQQAGDVVISFTQGGKLLAKRELTM
jgi:hypothetical protein